MKKGNKTISSIFKGSKAIDKIYKGTLTVYEAFKELIASGVPPITLMKCKGADLIDYKMHGNSIQKEIKLADLQFETGSLSNTLGLTFEEQLIADKTRVRMTKSLAIEKNKNYVIKSDSIKTLGFRLYDDEGLCTYASSVALSNGYYIFSSTINTSMAFTVVNCTDVNVKYEIYEIVSPENPIEVESVGDKTKNLFDDEKWLELLLSRDTSAYPTITGTEDGHNYIATYPKNPNIEFMKDEFKENTQYTMTFYGKIDDETKLNGTGLTITYKDGSVTRMLLNSTSWKKYTATTTANKTVDRIGLYYNHFVRGYYSDVMLTEGTETLEYEKYGKYKIPVIVGGKNLFDISKTTKFYNNKLVDVSSLYAYITNDIITIERGMYGSAVFFDTNIKKFEKGSYTFTVDVMLDSGEPDINKRGYIGYLKEDGTTTNVGFVLDEALVWKKIITTIIFNEDTLINGLQFQPMGSASNYSTINMKFKNIQILKGHYSELNLEFEKYVEPITTNIYLDEPLRKIGDYTDYIDFKNQKVVRNIYKYDLTGNETGWSDRGLGYDNYGIVFRNGSLLEKPANFEYKNAFCNYFPYGSIASAKGIFSFANSPTDWQFSISDGQLGISKDEEKSVRLQKWLEWLQTNYSNGNPVSMYYVLAEEITENIELPNITTFKGTTIIEVDTNILPSNMEVEYIGKEG